MPIELEARGFSAQVHKRILCTAWFGALVCSVSSASADVASFLFVGTGPSWLEQGPDEFAPFHSLQFDAGVGSSPAAPLIVGGLFRTQTHFERGTDLALLARGASRGFAQGDFGLAVDLGGYQRFWGEGSSGAMGGVVLGAPWGLTLSLGGSLGSADHLGFSALLGVDLARLTVHRVSGGNWWPNPFIVSQEARRTD